MRFDFLLCSERCGSNLITKILDRHPAVCGPFPSHVMRTFCPQGLAYGDLGILQNWARLAEDAAFYLANIFAQWETAVSAEELRERPTRRSLAELIRYVYEKEAAAAGKCRVFVKENHAYRFIPFTLAHFPESRFLWVVRDPRDMALSQRNSVLPGGVQRASDVWRTDQKETLRVYGYLRDTDRVLLVKFEDLVQSPETTVRRVCDFLDLAYAPEMLEFHRGANLSKNAEVITAWADLAQPILPDNVGRYRIELSEDEIRFVEAVCESEMLALGYVPDFPSQDAERLRERLPDEGRFDVAFTEAERLRYTRYHDALAQLRERWAATPVVLD